MKKSKYQTILKKIKKRELPFELITQNGRPIFVRDFYSDEWSTYFYEKIECRFWPEDALLKVFEYR